MKGNEYIRSKEFTQAINYYGQSLELNPDEAATYCNRAMAYLKTKQFRACVEDCNKALAYNAHYVKAFHRRA